MNIETVPIDSLHFDPSNVRKHDAKNIDAIKASIARFGQQKPIVIDADGVVRAGNGTLSAMRALSFKEIKVVRTPLRGSEATAYAIADNRTAELAEWDDDALSQTLAALQIEDEELALATGFDASDIDALLAPDEVIEDEVPEPPAVAITKRGDVWLLGSHRVMCGDSTSADDVARFMNGVKADLCFTSPPYGQQRDYTKESDCSDWDKLMRGVFENLPMADAGQVLVNLGMIHRDGEWLPYWDGWIEWMRTKGWRRFAWYVWDQMHGLRGDWSGRFAPSHEFIFHFNKQAKKPIKWVESLHAGEKGGALRSKSGTIGDVTSEEIQTHKLPDSVWRIQRQKGGIDGHPAPFSIALVVHALKSWNGIVYDPFIGSGSTLIAAEQLNRKCYGMEISPQYCDVIVARWEKLTGKKATLEK